MEARRRVAEDKEEVGEDKASDAQNWRVSVTVRRQLTTVPKTWKSYSGQLCCRAKVPTKGYGVRTSKSNALGLLSWEGIVRVALLALQYLFNA